jgi:hypothetical protein
MPADLTKAQRRRVRELVALAYERELGRELGLLEVEFSRWRHGELDVLELSDLIHRFHDGVARDLYSAYTNNMPDLALGSAIARGILSPDEVPPEIRKTLEGHFSFVQTPLDEQDTQPHHRH